MLHFLCPYRKFLVHNLYTKQGFKASRNTSRLTNFKTELFVRKLILGSFVVDHMYRKFQYCTVL